MQVGGAREVAWHAVVAAMSGLHTLSMSKRGHPKHNRRPTFIKAWRKARGLTLERLSEQLLLEREVEITDGQLSRIERGESPYSQDLLEAIAEVLRCEPAHLLNVNPSDAKTPCTPFGKPSRQSSASRRRRCCTSSRAIWTRPARTASAFQNPIQYRF